MVITRCVNRVGLMLVRVRLCRRSVISSLVTFAWVCRRRVCNYSWVGRLGLVVVVVTSLNRIRQRGPDLCALVNLLSDCVMLTRVLRVSSVLKEMLCSVCLCVLRVVISNLLCAGKRHAIAVAARFVCWVILVVDMLRHLCLSMTLSVVLLTCVWCRVASVHGLWWCLAEADTVVFQLKIKTYVCTWM